MNVAGWGLLVGVLTLLLVVAVLLRMDKAIALVERDLAWLRAQLRKWGFVDREDKPR